MLDFDCPTLSHTTSVVLSMYDKTFKVFIHFKHLVWIWWFASLSISLSFYIMNLKYLNCVFCGILWSKTYISKVEMSRLLLKWLSMSPFLHLFMWCRTLLRLVSKSHFMFNSSTILQKRQYHLQKGYIYLSVSSWKCSLNTFKTKIKK